MVCQYPGTSGTANRRAELWVQGCQHRMGIRVFLVDGKLFLRENTPRNIPYNPYGPCTAAGPYVWFDHPEAYEKQ